MDHNIVSFIVSVIFSKPTVLQRKVTIAIGCSVGGLGLIIVCGVIFISMLCCFKLGRVKKQHQQQSDKDAKESSVQQNCSQNDEGRIRPANNLLQENACCGSEQILTDIRCGALAADDDDADYDDTVIPAELTRPRQNRDTGATIELCLQRVDNAPTGEDGDYDDIITAIETNQQRRETVSFETKLNPAYCSTLDCVLVSSLGLSLPELEPDDKASESESCEQKNDSKLNIISGSLSDNDVYICNDDYLNDSTLPGAKVTPKLPDQDMSPSQPQSHSVDKGSTSESDHEYDYPNVVNEIQEQEDNVGFSIQRSVVHAYVYTTSIVVENHKSMSPLPIKQQSLKLSPSPSLSELNSNTGCNHDKSEGRRGIIESPLASHMMLCMDRFDHLDARSKTAGPVQIQFQSSAKPSKTSPCEDDEEHGDPDYVFDRLGDCLYLDPHKILNTSDLDTSKKSSHSIEDVHYSHLSPVTFWEGEWTQQDLLKANAIYTDVRKKQKKTKTLDLDEMLGTLV